MRNWVNLHTHGVCSFLDGYSRYGELSERAVELGQPALGITEHGNVHGWLDFYRAAKSAGVKPILGMEAYQARKMRSDRDEEERSGPAVNEWDQRGPHHLTLIARNYEGYRNIIKISSRAFLEGYYVKPRMDFELLRDHSEGVTVLSGCLSGKIQQAILREDYRGAEAIAREFQEIVGKENFYIEIMDHGIEEELRVYVHLVALAIKIDAKIIPTQDCHYTHKGDSPLHDLMLCVSTKATVTDEKRFKFVPDQFYLKSYDEMESLFLPEWLQNTLDLSERCELDLQFGELYFPDFPLPPGRELDEYLEDLVWRGIVKRYGAPIPADVKERTEYELGVVRRMGFQSYFLVVWDLVRWAREQGIRVGYGRGSAAGSIISYALRITNLEPLKFGLLFERFLIEGRKNPPDIDIDFDDRYRDKVIDYARSKYGDDHVANICTFASVGAKSAIRDAGRALGYEYAVGDRIAKFVPPPVLGITKTLEESLATEDMRAAYEKEEDTRLIMDAAKGLEGLLRQPGMHASGVIISKNPVIDYVPVMRKGEDKPIITQWDMVQVEENGLLKIDFLGLRNLGVVDDTWHRIIETLDEDIDFDEIPTDDPYTYEQLCLGNTMGVFQMESAGLQKMTVAMKPSTIEDLMALISLYRPGPMGSGMDKMYIARKHGRERITYTTPKLADVLGKTYGIMLYQEDVINVARHLAGFSIPDADDLRKAIGKKQMDKIGNYRKAFVAGCRSHSDIDAHISEKIYSDIEYFAGYGFGMAHAASYAMLAYLTAYLKFHYEAPYMASLLSSVEKPEEAAPYIAEARRLGLQVYPPDVNKSNSDFTVMNDKEILFGLRAIGGIGPAVLPAILDGRPASGFTSVYDFLRRADTSILNKASLMHLVNAGALDSLIPPQEDRSLSRDKTMELLNIEKGEIGVYVTDHPVLGIWHLLEPEISHEIIELGAASMGEQITIGGLVTRVNHIVTRKNKKMARFFLEDMAGSIEVTIFPGMYEKVKRFLVEGEIVFVKGRVEKDGDEQQFTKVLGFELQRVDIPTTGNGQPIMIEFTSETNYSLIKKIEELIEQMPGDSPLFLALHEDGQIIRMKYKKPTSPDIEPLINRLIGLN